MSVRISKVSSGGGRSPSASSSPGCSATPNSRLMCGFGTSPSTSKHGAVAFGGETEREVQAGVGLALSGDRAADKDQVAELDLAARRCRRRWRSAAA
jgi:hypothetical protein